MPTATLIDVRKHKSGHVQGVQTTKTITHNNARLYHENGRSYEHVGVDSNGDRIYRDTAKR